MFKKVFTGVAAAMVLTASANAAHFVEIQAPSVVDVGEQFDITIVGDFLALGFIAGGVQLTFDAGLLQLDNFSTPLGVDADLSCPGAALCPMDPPGTFSIVWGQFLSDLIAPNAGPTLMATITVTALADGVADLALLDFTDFTGGWFGAGFSTIDPPELLGASVQIAPAVIPLPAAVWMMIGGLGALARFRRK